MHRKALIIGIIAVVGVGGFLVISLNIDQSSKMKIAQNLINQIEEYYHVKGFYPKSLEDLGLKESEEGPIYYKNVDNKYYILWFGTTVGESKEYDCRTKHWR